MSFDEEVDALKTALVEEQTGGARRTRIDTLTDAKTKLEGEIASRRLEFALDDSGDTDDEPSLVVRHAATGDELGSVFADEDGLSFEAEEDDYFADLDTVSEVSAFVAKLYDVLKNGMAAYELDVEPAAKD